MHANTPQTPANPFPGGLIPVEQGVALLRAYRAMAEAQPSKAAQMFHAASCKGEGQLEKEGCFLPISLAEFKDAGDKTTNAAFARWIDARRSTLQAIASQQGLDVYLDIDIPETSRGGRGRSPLATWIVRSIDSETTGVESEDEALSEGAIQYRVQPVVPSFPFRMIFDRQGRPVRRSTQGLIAMIFMTIVLAMALFAVALLTLVTAPAVTGWTVVSVTTFALAGWLLIGSTRPLWQLPEHKVVIAPWWLLAWNEPFAVLHMASRTGPRGTMRPTALVRYTTECPVCGSDVELAEGGAQYPGRVVGRCLDAPSEHVLTFDPVKRLGAQLLPATRD